jgi:hypothetical protein
MTVQQAPQLRCRRCGTLDVGTYCSGCGAVLSDATGRTWLQFADSFLKVTERGRYLRTYGRLLASPTRNTLALYAEGNPTGAFQFLQTSLLIYTLAVLSRVISGGTVVSMVALPVMLLCSQAIFLALFYWLAHRKSRSGRSGHQFLILSAYSTGFTLPIAAALQAYQTAEPLWGLLALLVACIPMYVYALRVWARFWQLSKRRVFAYLLVATMVNTIVWIAAGVAYALLFLVPASA